VRCDTRQSQDDDRNRKLDNHQVERRFIVAMFSWEEELHVGWLRECGQLAPSAFRFSLRRDGSVEKLQSIKEANRPDRLAEAFNASQSLKERSSHRRRENQKRSSLGTEVVRYELENPGLPEASRPSHQHEEGHESAAKQDAACPGVFPGGASGQY